MNIISATFLLVLLSVPNVANAKGQVDPALVGTWQLQYAGPPIFWVIRDDGVYRIHGPQTPNTSHRGQFQAADGKWTLNSPNWQDSGTYKLSNKDTWITVGKLGPGTWNRVWKPGESQEATTRGTPACELLSLSEVAPLLAAPKIDSKRQGGPEEGCKYTSRLNDQDQLKLWMTHGSTISETFQRERESAHSAIDLAGVGRAAYATISRNGILTIHVLGKEGFDASRHAHLGTLFKLTLKLSPKTTPEDIPLLANLARFAFDRWGGKKPLGAKTSPSLPATKRGFNLGSLFYGSTPLPPSDKGACLVSSEEIQSLMEVPFETGIPYGPPQLKTSVKKAICKYRQLQGYGGEIEITFHSRSSTRSSWMRKKSNQKFYKYHYVSGIGDDAYWHFVESGTLLRVSALFGNSQLSIEWKGNNQRGSGPTRDKKDQMLNLLKVAGERLQ